MARKESIIKKYGSWENYEKIRNEKVRATALKKCKNDEERKQKIKQWEWLDYLKSIFDPSKVGKECECLECNSIFIANKNQTSYCPKCILKLARIRNYGSLEEYYKTSTEKNKKTKLERYGDENYNNRDRATRTCLEKYNVESPMQVPDFIERGLKTKEIKYGSRNFNNRKKYKETCLEKYGKDSYGQYGSPEFSQFMLDKFGVENYFYLEEFKEKSKKTKLEKYGDENYTNIEKSKQTLLDKYGKEFTFQIDEIKVKSKNTLLKKYDVDNFNKLEKQKQKISQRMKENNPMKNEEVKEKMITSCLNNGGFSTKNFYKYKNLFFESSWELYYYLFLEKQNICFIYKPSPLSYIDDEGTSRKYFPDFKTDHYIEIKGSHLINKDGILQTIEGTPLFAKTKFLKEINTEIVGIEKISPIIKEIDKLFGKDFVKSKKVIYGKDS